MIPVVAVAQFLKGWTVYWFDGRPRLIFHQVPGRRAWTPLPWEGQ